MTAEEQIQAEQKRAYDNMSYAERKIVDKSREKRKMNDIWADEHKGAVLT